MALRFAILAALFLIAASKGGDRDIHIIEGVFGAPKNVVVDCKMMKDKYTAVVKWEENAEALLQEGGFMDYKVEYRSTVLPRWTGYMINGGGTRARIKLAPGASYEFRVIGMSGSGASKPSPVAEQSCTF